MLSAILQFRSSRLHYLYCDHGGKLLFYFHGYGESGRSIQVLEPLLQKQYSIVGIDLPFHGRTEWNEGLEFTVPDLCKIMDEIRLKHFPSVSSFMLAGYSMGGRVVLSLLQEKCTDIDKVLLMAPDGFTVNIWYWLATQVEAGRRLFYLTMQKPGWFFSILKTTRRLSLVNESIYKFVHYYIDDERVRKELYNRWVCMRRFRPDLSVVRANIQTNRIPVRLLYGKHDRIITPGKGRKFCKGLGDLCQLQIVDTGHQVVHSKNAGIICTMLER
jgi:pimeloyl-ACP methyl ester carboxylesterase